MLQHHPDKQQKSAEVERSAESGDAERPSATEEEDDEMFKALTEAFELLSTRAAIGRVVIEVKP